MCLKSYPIHPWDSWSVCTVCFNRSRRPTALFSQSRPAIPVAVLFPHLQFVSSIVSQLLHFFPRGFPVWISENSQWVSEVQAAVSLPPSPPRELPTFPYSSWRIPWSYGFKNWRLTCYAVLSAVVSLLTMKVWFLNSSIDPTFKPHLDSDLPNRWSLDEVAVHHFEPEKAWPC